MTGGVGQPENGPGGYVKYADDAQQAHEELGADTFRMGIEWSRIFPRSTAGVTGPLDLAKLKRLVAGA